MLAAIGVEAAYLTSPITIDTVKVGDAGNLGDTGGTVGRGAVAYDYYIGTTEVTAGQYASFLNAVASTDDTFGLYNASMADSTGCGIVKTTVDGVSTYTVTNGNLPVNYVSALDAMRFCNWLTSGNTEIGVASTNGSQGSNFVIRDNVGTCNCLPQLHWTWQPA